MKFYGEDKKYLKISLYVLGTFIAMYIAYSVMDNVGDIFNWFLKALGTIAKLLKPLLIAFVIAYLLYPLVSFFEKIMTRKHVFKKVKTRRGISIVITYIIVISALVGIIVGIYFMIGGKLTDNMTITGIVNGIVDYVKNLKFSLNDIQAFIDKYNIPIPTNVNDLVEKVIQSIQGFVSLSFSNITATIGNISSNILAAFIAVFISIYLLIDTEYFMDIWKKFYYMIFRKSKVGKGLTNAAMTVHHTFYNYLKGQFLDAMIVGILSSIALALVGIDYAIVIGIIAGICNMIPYIGPFIGTGLAIIMALLAGDVKSVIWVIVAMIIVQQIDNNLLAPRIVGNSVGLHPIFTMLAILIGGDIGGLAGMLLAVPLTAAAKIIIGDWYNKHIDYPKPLRLKFESEDTEIKK